MTTITIDIPGDLARALHVPPDDLGNEVRLAAAAKLYELGRLSTGAAAQVAGLPRTVFLTKLADYGVDTFDLTEEELRQQVIVPQLSSYRITRRCP